MKKKLLLGAIGIGVIGAISAIAPTLAYAATDSTTPSTFVTKLAEKLGIDVSTVQTAVDATKTDIKAENDATRKTEIAQAVTDGTLTQRQADILIAEMDIEPSKPAVDSTKPDFSTMTEEERKAAIETMKTEREQAVVDALNEKGLATTLEEVQATREAARTAGLAKGPGFRGHGLKGFGGGL
ncbi:MAG: hypothetical protein ABIM99_00630 [Candidatus Dojkabacteria bacterium]